MTDTRRTQVLDAIAKVFEDMTEGEPAADPMGVKWSIVSRDPLGQIPKGKLNAIGIYGLTSSRTAQTYGATITMPCVAEVYVRVPSGEGKARTLEMMVGVVERALQLDPRLGGVCTDIRVTGEQTNLDSPFEDQVDGALFFDVLYMQSERDPRRNRG